MEKNVLYITYVDYLESAFPGVQIKIQGQTMAMEGAGLHVDRVNQYGRDAQLVTGGETCLISAPLPRLAIYRAVKAAVEQRHYMAAYIRFQFFSEDVRKICKLLKSRGVRVLMEFPTYPYEGELHQQGPKGEIKLLCDRLYRRPCAKYIDAFVTQAEEPKIYGVNCIRVLNGLDYATHPLRTIRPARADALHLVAVASMLPWHGYDRLLHGLAVYKGGTKVVLHLVGQGKEIAKYREIVEKHYLEDQVVFHGAQGGAALEEIVSGCDIAVGSLGAFRIGLKKMSTLKSREYCAWGFPSVNATPTDILSMEDPFCLFVPEDESAVDVEQIVQFYHRVYFDSGLTARQIGEKIRAAAEGCSDVRAVFRPVIEFMERGEGK